MDILWKKAKANKIEEANFTMKTRQEAWGLLKEHNKDEKHIQHALAVEAAMRFFAEKKGEDADTWGIAGLLHDIDWEEVQDTPEKHTHEGASWLSSEGYPEEIVRAVQAHGWGMCSDVEPLTDMEKNLYGVEGPKGTITAAALVRPSRSLEDLKVKSVKKKWKDKAFARGVNREVIDKGVEMLNTTRDELIEDVLEAMRPVEKELGLGRE